MLLEALLEALPCSVSWGFGPLNVADAFRVLLEQL